LKVKIINESNSSEVYYLKDYSIIKVTHN